MHVVFDRGLFDLRTPHIVLPIRPLARVLARIYRWSGNTPITVAQHSVMASYLSRHPREALFHDAAEALLGDINTPLKERFPQLRAYEEEVLGKIFTGMGLTWPLPQEVRHVDARLAATEGFQFFGIKSPRAYPLAIRAWSGQEAAVRFIARAQELGFDCAERNPYGMAETLSP